MSDQVRCCKIGSPPESYEPHPDNKYAMKIVNRGGEWSNLIQKNIRSKWTWDKFEANRTICEDCGQVYGWYQLGSDDECYFRLPWIKQKPWLHRFMMKYLLGWEWKWV